MSRMGKIEAFLRAATPAALQQWRQDIDREAKKRAGSVRKVEEPVIPKQMQKDVYGVYEKAVGLLREEKIDQAQKLLRKILTDYPDETEVLARVRNFMKICEKKLTQTEARPQRSADRRAPRRLHASARRSRQDGRRRVCGSLRADSGPLRELR